MGSFVQARYVYWRTVGKHPIHTPNFTEPSEEYEPWRKTLCVLPSRYDLKNGRELEFQASNGRKLEFQACTS